MPAEEPAVVVLGACFIDLVSYVSKFPKPGETRHGHGFERGYGGKAANQAVMAALMARSPSGASPAAAVKLIGRVGDDSDGHGYLEVLRKQGVDTSLIAVTPDTYTGNAAIYVADGGENMIVINTGATGKMSPSDYAPSSACATALRSATVVVCQNENPLHASIAAIRAAHAAGACTLWNAAPADAAAAAAVSVRAEGGPLLPAVTVLVVNEGEARCLAGDDLSGVKAGEDEAVAAEAAGRHLCKQGSAVVIVTLGPKGSVIVACDADGKCAVTHVPATVVPKADVVDTTGAGDCFVGSLAVCLAAAASKARAAGKIGAGGVDGWIRGIGTGALEIFGPAAKAASTAAGMSVRARGTQKSYPARAEIAPAVLTPFF